MTVGTESPVIRYEYSGPGGYDFDFKVTADVDLLVTYTAADGGTRVLVLNTDYTVDLNPVADGGTVNVTDPLDTDGYLEIRRDMVIDQQTDWVNNDPFDMDILERAIDKLTMIVQQQDVVVQEGTALLKWRGPWATGVNYLRNDIVQWPNEQSNQYAALFDHTSGDFATDLANGLWQIYLDVSFISQEADRSSQEADRSRDEANRSASEAAASAASAAAALASELNAKDSEDAAALSEANAAASEAAAAQSEAAAAISAQNSHNWASEDEDIPVIDNINPIGFSSFHWAKKAEAIVQQGGVDPAGEYITPSVDFITDLNNHDFSSHRLASPTIPTAIRIEVHNTLDIGYGGEVYRYYGNKPVDIGLGAPPQVIADWALASTALASGISFLPTVFPASTNVQDAIQEIGDAVGRWNVIAHVANFTATYFPGFPTMHDIQGPLTVTIEPASSGGFGIGDVITLVQENEGDLTIALNGVTVRLPEERGLNGRSNNATITLVYMSETVLLAYGDLGDA